MDADRELRDLFEAEIRRIDQILSEREKQVNLALLASQKAIDKAEAEGLRSREQQNEWRAAFSDRERDFTTKEAHDLLEAQVDYLRRAMDTGQGRRTAWVAAAGIIATILAIGVGQILRSGITASDVSSQIRNEAPWNHDKAAVERRISTNERAIESLKIKTTQLQEQILILAHK